MSNVYLIDFENVHCGGLKNATKLRKEDEIIIFYSSNASAESKGVRDALKSCKAKVTYKEVYLCGKNSLDFQLVAYLGTLAEDGKNKTFYIVSKDKDYLSVLLFFRDTIDTYLIPKILVDFDDIQEKKIENDSMVKVPVKGISINRKEEIEKEVLKKAKKQKMKRTIVIHAFQNSKDANAYLSNLNMHYKKRGKMLHDETKGLFLEYRGIPTSNTRLVEEKGKSAKKQLMEIVLGKQMSFVAVYNAIKRSENKGIYHGELSKLYKDRGRDLYLETRHLFDAVKNEKI